ncbi:MAG TPA: UDP-N-acetylmuramoyl-L-alanine--D-glutamate ligase [Rhodopila sp.]|uniref:UDP-N-acetylmuramoyl-L-alanine--D-glutamate ligase n=1 Tax=Rhodopila sp. TaxID=2480087 RepID=UPI002C247DB6|nr:UDP-N-acetylmuramoyl-L-alanine--D-glutamate ligase [Rhodopila sp.]HVY13737.1 UDP-N-acetylmuramoyl-L-alanine--D-glutamate ligase [Rhodopila sp.]
MSTFPPDLFRGRRFAVLGLGKNGLPAAHALAAMGAEVVAWDDNEKARAASTPSFPSAPPSWPGAKGLGATGQGDGPAKPGHGGGEDSITLRDPTADPGFRFDALVLSPGIPHRLPNPHPAAVRAREAGVPILSDTELLYRAVRGAGSKARFAGITGTNGKSTTTALLAHILVEAGVTAAAGANLGPAALSLPLLPQDAVYVLEMSSYMLERIDTLRFDAAAMLNLSADHLDRHGDMAGYASAKRAIFARQTAGDLAVIGVDDAGSQAMADWLDTRPARVARVSGQDRPLAQGPALPGAHNAQNAAAATVMARFFGVSDDAIAAGLRSFPGLPHRQQRIVTVDGITFVNDSKATNADAAERALVCYDRLIWIAGGMAKEGGIEPLVPLFPRIARAILIGRDAPQFAATLTREGVPFDMVGTLDAAVPAAFAAAKDADAPIVLLSPACASWDQFTGYDQRGDRFAEIARSLAGGA